MNWKKFLVAFIAVWIFIFIYGFIFHMKIMRGSYLEMPSMWRPQDDARGYFPLLVLGQGVVAFFFTLIFVRGFGSGGGIGGGFRFGLLLALLVCGANLIRYAVEPITTSILFGWWIGEVIQFSLAGAIVGAIYKPASV